MIPPAEQAQVAQVLEEDAELMSNTALQAQLAGQPQAIQDEIIRINTEARPIALQVALLVPVLAGLLGFLISLRMMRLPGHQAGGLRRGVRVRLTRRLEDGPVTDQEAPRPEGPFLPGRAVSEPSAEAITDAVRQVRAPWAASVAGILFAVLFTAAMVLLRSTPVGAAGRRRPRRACSRAGDDWPIVVGGLYLGPFAGITFLWFVAVVRDQVGEREDRFFATVFLGSAILFVALLFVALAVATTPVVAVRFLDLRAPTAEEARLDPVARVHAAVRLRDPGGGRVPVLDGDPRPADAARSRGGSRSRATWPGRSCCSS